MESAYLIGGCVAFTTFDYCSEYSAAIARYIDNEWSLVGGLKTGRFKHRSIMVGNRAYIIGGQNQEYVEMIIFSLN